MIISPFAFKTTFIITGYSTDVAFFDMVTACVVVAFGSWFCHSSVMQDSMFELWPGQQDVESGILPQSVGGPLAKSVEPRTLDWRVRV